MWVFLFQIAPDIPSIDTVSEVATLRFLWKLLVAVIVLMGYLIIHFYKKSETLIDEKTKDLQRENEELKKENHTLIEITKRA